MKNKGEEERDRERMSKYVNCKYVQIIFLFHMQITLLFPNSHTLHPTELDSTYYYGLLVVKVCSLFHATNHI